MYMYMYMYACMHVCMYVYIYRGKLAGATWSMGSKRIHRVLCFEIRAT